MNFEDALKTAGYFPVQDSMTEVKSVISKEYSNIYFVAPPRQKGKDIVKFFVFNNYDSAVQYV